MCNTIKSALLVRLLLPLVSSAFSPVLLPDIRKAQQGRGEPSLRAEEDSYGPSFSRRGFVESCVAATVACGAVVVSPARADRCASPSIRPSDDDHVDFGSQNLVSGSGGSESTAFQESVSGFVSGSAVSAVKTLVKYPLDTATVRLQMPNTPFTVKNLPALFAGSLDGIAAPLVSNIPGGAVFFAVKDAAKSALKESGPGLPQWASTSLAVGAALPPYWLLRNPSEVVKTRLQAGAEGYREGVSTLDAFKLALENGGDSTMDGVGGLYRGYTENILYGFPADIVKFVAYDYLAGGRGKKDVSPADGAVYGALATALAQLATTPLDVVRNRIMAEVSDGDEGASRSTPDSGSAAGPSYIERFATIAREEGVEELFAGSSPRVAKAVLSGAIQFATYEETKRKMSRFFVKE